jgi:hypothetical protein
MNENENNEPSENEVWFDKEIAPKLLDLANQSGDRGISFLSVVEYAHGERSRTQRLAPNAGLEMIMVVLCEHSGLNVDGYLINLIRYCNKNNIDISASIFLNKYAAVKE